MVQLPWTGETVDAVQYKCFEWSNCHGLARQWMPCSISALNGPTAMDWRDNGCRAYDLDGDGVLDILVLTTTGEFVALRSNGDPIPGKHNQLPLTYVARDWHQKLIAADRTNINNYILDMPPDAANEASYVAISPRVLASALLVDLTGGGVPDQLVIPVSYYVEPTVYGRLQDSARLPDRADLDNYLASAVVIFNLTSMQPVRTIPMELTKVTSEYPGYILFSPVVADLDGNRSKLEIIVATSAGYLHVVNADGQTRPGFPVHTDTVCGQVAVEDINGDGQLDLVAADRSGNVECYTADGHVLWQTRISSSCTSGPQVADLRLRGAMDITIATDDGQLWVLDGLTGRVVPGWPVRIARSLTAPVLVTRLSHTPVPSLVTLADDRHIHVISGEGVCRQTFNVGEQSFVSIVSQELVTSSPGLELLVASRDGTVLCIGQAPHQQVEPLPSLYSSPTEHLHNVAVYYNGQRGLTIEESDTTDVEFSGSVYTLSVHIHDNVDTSDAADRYRIDVVLGNQLLTTRVYESPGQYDIKIDVPHRPLSAQIQVRLTTRHGQVFTDHIPVSFHKVFIADLQWLMVVPTLLVAALLLFTHGFPSVDLLPRSLVSKGS
ncbi:hypothetical protein LSAT2_021785 [Lamellibrachia satsuma]|nr:hypothetical protein LSAT2_021785 [Lamellibrachia satsuma]